jgi:hypothetical protein
MTMMIRMVVVSILSSFDLHGDERIMMWQAYFVAYRVKYATAQHVADAQVCEQVTIELLMSENLAYIKNKKRGSRERSSPPCQIKTLILPRCPKARGNIYLDLTLTQKFCRTLAPRGATLTDHVCAPSNGFRAAVYDSIGPPLTFMIINSGTRWLPEPETFGSSRGGGLPKAQTGHQPRSLGRRLET